jgi:hypothetical protein
VLNLLGTGTLKLKGETKVGRPRMRWTEDVHGDSEELKVKGWKQKANRREEWASVICSLRMVQPRSK